MRLDEWKDYALSEAGLISESKLTDADNVIGEFVGWAHKHLPGSNFMRSGTSSSSISKAEGRVPRGGEFSELHSAIDSWLKGYGLKPTGDRKDYTRYQGIGMNKTRVMAGISKSGNKVILSIVFSWK